jgi:hypothetical protein
MPLRPLSMRPHPPSELTTSKSVGPVRFVRVPTVPWHPRRLYVYTVLECRVSLVTSIRPFPPLSVRRVVFVDALVADR